MSDGRLNRKKRVVPFIDRLEKDRQINFKNLLRKAKLFEMDGFEDVEWNDSTWTITGGRLIKETGKNTKNVSLNFNYSPKLGGDIITDEWTGLIKALMLLRFHRNNQAAPNQRNFILAVGYIAHIAYDKNISISGLVPEIFDEACKLITKHYAAGTAYNLHKAIAEFSAHCDANSLCRIEFKYKYSAMNRPDTTGGILHKRLDDPEVLETKNDKMVAPEVFKVIGSLYLNVPKDHKYRFYVLVLTLLACLGRRFSEISLLPYQLVENDIDDKKYIEYYPRKSSQGDVYTPRKKLYLSTDVIPIVVSVFDELNENCEAARKTAKEMQEKNGPDLSFVLHIDEAEKLYKDDLIELGLPPVVLNSNGWLYKNGYSYPDEDKLTKQGIRPANPIRYTTKEGIVAYCNKNYFDTLIQR